MRRAAKIDANHTEIVQALRDAGCEVLSLAVIGKGCPDALIYIPNQHRFVLVEIKDGKKPPSARSLTPDQVRWHLRWPVSVVTSVDEALVLIKRKP